MPYQSPPKPGTEFSLGRVSNGDGTFLEVFSTVDEAKLFSLRTDNGGSKDARVVVDNVELAARTGSAEQSKEVINKRWDEVGISICSVEATNGGRI
jgi:hypothetical protein